MYEAYPLQWPAGWPRTKDRKDSSFKMTPDKSRKDLLNEVDLLSGDKNPIISSNVPLRKRDGHMYADIASEELDDPGVAVYFMLKGKQMSLACDRWLTPAENMRALGLTINALRGLNRWGSSQIIERAFSGFAALPETTMTGSEMWELLGLPGKPATIEEVHNAYKTQAKKWHPDVSTGDKEMFHQLQQAYKFAKGQFNSD